MPNAIYSINNHTPNDLKDRYPLATWQVGRQKLFLIDMFAQSMTFFGTYLRQIPVKNVAQKNIFNCEN